MRRRHSPRDLAIGVIQGSPGSVDTLRQRCLLQRASTKHRAANPNDCLSYRAFAAQACHAWPAQLAFEITLAAHAVIECGLCRRVAEYNPCLASNACRGDLAVSEVSSVRFWIGRRVGFSRGVKLDKLRARAPGQQYTKNGYGFPAHAPFSAFAYERGQHQAPTRPLHETAAASKNPAGECSNWGLSGAPLCRWSLGLVATAGDLAARKLSTRHLA
jgi:hypothetical protein